MTDWEDREGDRSFTRHNRRGGHMQLLKRSPDLKTIAGRRQLAVTQALAAKSKAKKNKNKSEEDGPTASGVYVSILPTPVSCARIVNFFSLSGIDIVEQGDLHTTLMFDEDHELGEYGDLICRDRFNQPKPTAEVEGYALFGDDKDCLVLKLKSPELDSIFSELKDLGLKHSYSKFAAHITLSYNAQGVKIAGLPVPEFMIEFDPWLLVDQINKDYKKDMEPGGLRRVFQSLPAPNSDLAKPSAA